jgi:DNA-binding NarL/FixJ family response regulator
MNKKNMTTIAWLCEETTGKQNTGFTIDFLSDWEEMLSRLTNKNAAQIDLLIIDSNMFAGLELSISEMIEILHSMVKFTYAAKSINIAISIDKQCSFKLVKELQQYKILGIVPHDAYFGEQQFSQAIHALAANTSHWPSAIINNLKKLHSTSNSRNEIKLTARQSQVLALVGNRGLSNKKIATILGISESTVKIHMSAILKEFGVRNRTQLALASTSKLRA